LFLEARNLVSIRGAQGAAPLELLQELVESAVFSSQFCDQRFLRTLGCAQASSLPGTSTIPLDLGRGNADVLEDEPRYDPDVPRNAGLGIVVVLVSAACGRIGFGIAENSSDGGRDGGRDGVMIDDDGALVCGESPCRLVLDQCGCGAGQACQRVGATTDERACIANGTAPADGACSLDLDCVAGHACVGSGAGRCQRYCASDADCGQGLECAQLLEGVGIGFCGSTCTLDGGCLGADTCKVIFAFDFDASEPVAAPVCQPATGATTGTACSNSLECAPGLICDPNATVCRPLCRFDGSLDCTSGACTLTVAPIVLGGVEHGICG
jgi:hypothetical protein